MSQTFGDGGVERRAVAWVCTIVSCGRCNGQSYRFERSVWRVWPFDANGIGRPDVSTRDHAAHDAGLANEPAARIPVPRRGHQAWFEPVSYTHLRAHETDSYLVC